MTDETLTPIAGPRPNSSPIIEAEASLKISAPVGRQADNIAAVLASLGTALSVIAAIWFFAGFAENDKRPEHLASVFVFTTILFAFAILPFALTAGFARRAFRKGTKRAHLLWTLFLMLPWVLLASLAISHTPLPFWCGLIMATLAALLSLWALISLILDRKSTADAQGSNTYADTEL